MFLLSCILPHVENKSKLILASHSLPWSDFYFYPVDPVYWWHICVLWLITVPDRNKSLVICQDSRIPSHHHPFFPSSSSLPSVRISLFSESSKRGKEDEKRTIRTRSYSSCSFSILFTVYPSIQSHTPWIFVSFVPLSLSLSLSLTVYSVFFRFFPLWMRHVQTRSTRTSASTEIEGKKSYKKQQIRVHRTK